MVTNPINTTANAATHTLSAQPARASLDTRKDDEETTDDGWWEEEDTIELNPPVAATTIRDTRWPKPPVGLGLNVNSASRASVRKSDQRYSVQKPTRDKSKGRQRLQNAKAGIKLVTSFGSRYQKSESRMPSSQAMPQKGRYHDLESLQALTGESAQSIVARTKAIELNRAANTKKASRTSDLISFHAHSTSKEHTPRANDDLSPNDRPIVIGITIPSSYLDSQALSPQTALSDSTKILKSYEHRTPTNLAPETPTIIITPAQEVSVWSASTTGLTPSSERHHPVSSIYSQAPPSPQTYTDKDAPPVPNMPSAFLEKGGRGIPAQKSYFSPDSEDSTAWDDDYTPATRKFRRMSTCTVFEEDESPIVARTGRAVSVKGRSRAGTHTSVSTVATRRRSKGWWNYITTPFLTRSNTFATQHPPDSPTPALPSLAAAAAKAQEAGRNTKMWDKEYSPLTPKTATSTISGHWWKFDTKKPAGEQSPVVRDSRHKVQTSNGSLPVVNFQVAGFGTPGMSSIESGSEGQLSRENTSATVQSTSDREVPLMLDTPVPRTLPSNNPFAQHQTIIVSTSINTSWETAEIIRTSEVPAASQVARSQIEPPVYTSSPPRAKYKAIFPPGHALGIQYPVEPGPVSPGYQNTMVSRGGIPMSDVPLTPPARRPINLNSGYPELPVRPSGLNGVIYKGEHYGPPPKKANKAERKRRRHEKEDVAAHRAGGWWRGRGCVPDRGCYGRRGAEGRKRRRWYCCLILFFLLLIMLVVLLATLLHRKSNTTIEPSQWINITGFPPIFGGRSTVIAPVNVETNAGCVTPATQWSCDLPKELQGSVAPNQPNQPNFFLYIQWDNSSATNATFANVTGSAKKVATTHVRSVGNPVSAGQFIKHLLLQARDIVTFVPSPAPSSFAEDFFLGNTTDNIVSRQKAGEPTPFFISFLQSDNSTLGKRELPSLNRRESGDNDTSLTNLTTVIPGPSTNSDGTAAPGNLLPFPTQQPIRLYDRGLLTEHYGFYTYFDRSIFLKSVTELNDTDTNNGEVPADEDGGATEVAASFRVTWAQTRFLVQMWTRLNTTAQILNSTQHTSSSSSSSYNPVTDLKQPGSFPYPITITTDRHGGDPELKMVYFYSMDDRQHLVTEANVSPKFVLEQRGAGGIIINPAEGLIADNDTNTSLGGFDGGTGGCSCRWSNFNEATDA